MMSAQHPRLGGLKNSSHLSPRVNTMVFTAFCTLRAGDEAVPVLMAKG